MTPFRPVFLACLAFALAAPARAQDPKPDFKAELNQLLQEYARAVQQKKAPPAASAPSRAASVPDASLALRFRDLARRARSDDRVSYDAHYYWYLLLSPDAPDEPAVAEILTEHAGSQELARFATMLGYRTQHEVARRALARIARDSPHATVRAAALLGSVQQELDREPTAATDAVLARLEKEYGDTDAGQEAAVLRKLAVGKPAPDFAGKDQHDRPLRLSAFRGKVVLIDFWGYW